MPRRRRRRPRRAERNDPVNRIFALACLLLAAFGAIDARAQTSGTLFNTDGSTTQFTYVGQVNYGPGGLTVSGVTAPQVAPNNPVNTASGEGDPIIYGTQLYGQGAFVAQGAAGTKSQPVGVQANGWNFGDGEAWGLAAEAIAQPGSTSYLVGVENLVVNTNPQNFAWKIGNNAVFRCGRANPVDPPCTGNNANAWAYWVTSQHGTGWESAFKLDRDSLLDSPVRRATVFDFSDLDPSRDGSVILFRMPGGREITFLEFLVKLDAALSK